MLTAAEHPLCVPTERPRATMRANYAGQLRRCRRGDGLVRLRPAVEERGRAHEGGSDRSTPARRDRSASQVRTGRDSGPSVESKPAVMTTLNRSRRRARGRNVTTGARSTLSAALLLLAWVATASAECSWRLWRAPDPPRVAEWRLVQAGLPWQECESRRDWLRRERPGTSLECLPHRIDPREFIIISPHVPSQPCAWVLWQKSVTKIPGTELWPNWHLISAHPQYTDCEMARRQRRQPSYGCLPDTDDPRQRRKAD